MIEITEGKMQHLTENIEKALRYAGKAMQIIEESRGGGGYNERNDDWDDEEWDNMSRYGRRMGSRMGNRYGERYGERGGYGERSGYGERYGERGSGGGR